MTLLARLRGTFLRIDARSLGLFRVAMAAALLGDWTLRWSSLRDFYSNEGVLPNHAHLFHLLKDEQPRVWSLLHAFSTPGEAGAGLLLILTVYLLFLIGYKTRVFHVLSLLALISLTGRNTLLASPASDVAITLLAATAFLPCGSRFSLDSLLRSMKARDEKDADALNDRAPPGEEAFPGERAPGWSPTSLAALAVLLHLTIVLVATARLQSGNSWRDGTALHYALWVERWVSDIGMKVRLLPPGLLRGWTWLLRAAPLAVPVLLFVPAPRYSRPIAFWLLVLYGLTYGLLFSFGLWGFTFVAAAFLVISTEQWEAWQSRYARGQALTVIYDADCGVCLLIARILKRLDLRSHLTFQGNDLLTVPPGQKPPYRSAPDEEPARLLYRRSAPNMPVETSPLPDAVTDDLVLGTVVAVDEKGVVLTEGRAVAAMLRALPLGFFLALPFRIPGTAGFWDALYRKVPPRRYAISEALGLGACGVPAKPASDSIAEDALKPGQIAPSVRLRRFVTGALRDAGAVLLLAAALLQTGREGGWPRFADMPRWKLFGAITGWTRMRAHYDVLAPDVAKEDGVLVVDAVTRGGRHVDPLTGRAPERTAPHFRLGALWSTYADALLFEPEKRDLQKPFKEYLARGGRASLSESPENQIMSFDVVWLKYKLPAPGSTDVEILGEDLVIPFQRGQRDSGAPPPSLKMNIR